MNPDEPIDGFTVELDGRFVVLILSNRYGTTDRYHFSHHDAQAIGKALVLLTQEE
jgi:hypothetical protein